MSNHQLDARRLLCPMPVIKTQNLIKQLKAGDILEVWCTDPGTLEDIPAWCRIHNHEILQTQVLDRDILFRIKVL